MLINSRGKPMSTQELITFLGYRVLPHGGFPQRIIDYNNQTITIRCLPENKFKRRQRLEYLCRYCSLWLTYAGSSKHIRAHHPEGHQRRSNKPMSLNEAIKRHWTANIVEIKK